MSKAFTKESDQEEELEPIVFPEDVKNYVTPTGLAALQNELRQLLSVERPKVVETVSWAAGNGDRSENGDYIYGKKRLREIDRRVRYLTKSIESAVVVDPQLQLNLTKVFFGATVTYKPKTGAKVKVKLVGLDEADLKAGKISWVSPVAKALLKAEVGDVVTFETPAGQQSLKILAISYKDSL
jgi:transcription elongation factor GreB